MQLTKTIHLFASSAVLPGPKRCDVSKNPRYVDTRVDELFPARKSSIRLNLASRKETGKVSIFYFLSKCISFGNRCNSANALADTPSVPLYMT